MVDSQRDAKRRVGYDHLISNKGEWNNCCIKNVPKIIEQTELKKKKNASKNHAYAHHIFRAWYNGSYTMMAKPMKTVELHYPMIQFLIMFIMQVLNVPNNYVESIEPV